MPTVSVVVPNYNHARFLRRRIDTIIAQTYQDFELILLDDCSTDDSRAILSIYASDPRARLECNERNSGSTFKQWNKGVRLARGNYVWIAESDDYADPRLLARLVALLDSDPAIAFAYCRSWRVIDEQLDGFADSQLADPQRWASDFCLDGTEMFRDHFLATTPVRTASSVVFRRDVYGRIGGADETLRLASDWKVWGAMALSGKVAYAADPLNFHRYHAGSVRSTTQRAMIDVPDELAACRWILSRANVPEDELDRIRALKAGIWVPAILSLHSSLPLKRAILDRVRELDPHPFRRVLPPVVATVRRKILRHWRQLGSALFQESSNSAARAPRKAGR